MPAKRVSMRRIREILRLKHACGATDRAIARLGAHVTEYVWSLAHVLTLRITAWESGALQRRSKYHAMVRSIRVTWPQSSGPITGGKESIAE